jgi:hypothetical protein
MDFKLINESNYLSTILCPFNSSGGIPDMDMTDSAPKSVNLTLNIDVKGSGSFLVVYLPHNLESPLRIYVHVDSINRYIFWKTVPFDQTLSENFTYGRFVSGGMKIISATTSGTLFNISGTMNATAFQEIPSIEDDLTYNQISAYKRNSLDVVTSVPVSTGVTLIAFPDGDQQFHVFENANAHAAPALLVITSFYGINQGWALAPLIYDSDLDLGIIPANGWEYVDISGMVSLAIPGDVAPVNCSLVLTVYLEDVADDWITVNPVISASASFENFNSPALVYLTFPILQKLRDPRTLRRVTLTYVGPTPPTLILRGEVHWNWNTYYSTGTHGPGFLVGMKSIEPGQKVTIGGVGHYETVPDADLSRNITTRRFVSFHPGEMMLVSKYLSESVNNRLKQVYLMPEYQSFIDNKRFKDHTDLDRMATATGWTDWLKSVWTSTKPYAKDIGTVVGSTFGGPAGALIGSNIGDMIGRSSVYTARQGRSSLLGDDAYLKAFNAIVDSSVDPRPVTFNTKDYFEPAKYTNQFIFKNGFTRQGLYHTALFPYLMTVAGKTTAKMGRI